MQLYMAGYGDAHVKDFLSMERKKQIRILSSYFYMTKSTLKNLDEEVHSGDVFLDSGAFTAFTKKKEIDLDAYCSFILDHIDLWNVIAGLDVIGDDIASYENQKIMEDEYGIVPLPCFHYGEDFKYLEKYVAEYDYIAIGGLIAAGNKNIKPFLDKCFSDYVCDKNGEAKVNVHGFAMTSPVLMARYPWHSVDSSSWNYGARNCFVYIPRLVNGEWNFTKKPHPLVLSTSRTAYIREIGERKWAQIKEYFDYVGMELGESYLKKVSSDYKLKENEQWALRKNSGTVEVVEKPGVLTSPHARNVLNIIYFQEMEKHLTENPPIFKLNKKVTSFGLG